MMERRAKYVASRRGREILPEDLLYNQMLAVGLKPEREYCAIPKRRFRWDFAFPDLHLRLLVEVNGGTWGHMGHSTGSGIKRDYEKHNLATLAGWRQLTFTSDAVYSGEAVALIEEALNGTA